MSNFGHLIVLIWSLKHWLEGFINCSGNKNGNDWGRGSIGWADHRLQAGAAREYLSMLIQCVLS